uniref:Tudor domain-containing protein n=1 Tax=Elaeophora elaphi TaxID=1147741 RepID=A0A0R3RWE0_9BILA
MTSSPATAASSNLDDITASLFYQLRDKNRVYDFDILQCPKCPERLEALELDVYQENGQTYQRIWWTCRGIKNQSCHFPLWVPREIFWTKRTEEQMRTGYIPLPNIHLLPQRLWYLYPNVFRDKLSRGNINSTKKNNSGTVTPSSGHATRGSSVRPESALTENEECSRDSFLSTPLLSHGTSPCVPNEMEMWESEVPIQQIRIDEEGSLELIEDVRLPSANSQLNASDQKDYEWKSSGNVEGKDTMCNSKPWEMCPVPECVVTAEFPLDSFTDSFVQFCSQTDSLAQHQQEQFERTNSREQEIHSDNGGIIVEVLRPTPQNNISHTDQDFVKEAECDSEIPTKTIIKRKQNASFEKMFDVAACGDSISGSGCSLDRISVVVPSVNTKVRESVNIAQIREIFQKQKRQRSNSVDVNNDRAVASLVKELVVRVALERDFIRNEETSLSLCGGQTQNYLLKTISLEEAKRDFGDLTLEELMKGVNNLRSSAAAQNCLRRWPKTEINVQGRQPIVDHRLEEGVDKYTPYFEKNDSETSTKISTEMTTNLGVRPSLRKRRSESVDRPAVPRNLPADQKYIAAVEMALKQSIKGIKGPKETSPIPRTSILKGSPSNFRPDMISNEIFDSLNWRRPVHFGGRTNLDAFVTAYNLRYNRAEYLDALGSELCKRKIMKFVPSIPVKQQRLVRRMQQRRSGQEGTIDLETLKKAVDPNALRVQIAHRLGIKDLDSILPCSKIGNNQDNEINSKMQHIASAPLTVSPGICESVSMEYIHSSKDGHRKQLIFTGFIGEQASVSTLSESLCSLPISEYESKVKTEKERELKAPFILSFNDPEVDALVHRKYNVVCFSQGTSTSRIEYVDFESAFEEYENDEVQQLDAFFDTHFKSLVGEKEKVKWSECRDLVEVPGEQEWKLRCMAEAFPQYCWKYAEPQVIAHYHYNVATTADAPARQPAATLPVFYAHLPNSFSPYDFSIQPKSLNRARERLYQHIQAVYSAKNEFVISIDQILKFSKGSGVIVDLVDIGNDSIVKVENVRPLLKVFGRLPPLALRCRMKDVDMNDLTVEKVNAFQNLIKSCGDVVRVELADVSSVPFLVNLYHPTVQGTNLGKLFYRCEEHAEHIAARERRWNKKLARMNNDFSHHCTDEGSFEDEYLQLTHVLHLERLLKPITDEPLYISHIENSRFIYLHCEYHKKTIKKLEKHLCTKWPELKIVPEKWLIPTLACAYSDGFACSPCRVIVAEVGDQIVCLRSVDHGWKKNIPKADCLSGSLRFLTREFSETPLMYVCCLPNSTQYHPHRSETNILRSILPTGTMVNIRRSPCKRSLPFKVDIFLENNKSVIDIFEQLRIERRVIHPCFDLVPYRPSVCSELYEPDCNYQEDLEIFQPFAKGRLEYADL